MNNFANMPADELRALHLASRQMPISLSDSLANRPDISCYRPSDES